MFNRGHLNKVGRYVGRTSINGHYNVVNSSYVNTDVTSLKAEVKALKMLIEEKNQRIEDLKNVNAELGARLDMVLQYGQNRDH